MIYRVKDLQVQEHHSSHHTSINIQVNVIHQFQYTCGGRVVFPEPELGLHQEIVSTQVVINLHVDYPLHDFRNTREN